MPKFEFTQERYEKAKEAGMIKEGVSFEDAKKQFEERMKQMRTGGGGQSRGQGDGQGNRQGGQSGAGARGQQQ
ncbi:MAG: hypothetical protein JEZ07_15290 [Phycisphaerae bacterium]|nr:hypothetical protein [Phycisphaerae bacterium]